MNEDDYGHYTDPGFEPGCCGFILFAISALLLLQFLKWFF